MYEASSETLCALSPCYSLDGNKRHTQCSEGTPCRPTSLEGHSKLNNMHTRCSISNIAICLSHWWYFAFE